jgi:cell division protein FtsW
MRGLRRALRFEPGYGVDSTLSVSALCLLLLGLVMVASASVAVAQRTTGEPFYYFYRQIVFAGLGVFGGAVFFLVPLKKWREKGFLLLALALVLLLLVLLPGIGVEINGSRRWLDLGPVTLQTSMPALLLLVLYLAGYAARRREQLTRLSGLIKPMLPLGLASLLMLSEPDFGATAILIAVSLIVLFMAGARLRHFLLFAAVVVALLALIAVSSPYRVERLVSFTNPWAHPFSSGFQLVQSLIAIGRGEFFGVGLGNSVEKLLYLPEAQTDFLFSIIGEELGLIGSTVVIGLFSLVVWRGFVIARRALQAERLFGGYLAYGLSAWFGLQAFIHMGVTMGLLPTKGTTLPLMSYGGSSLVMACALIALLLRVDFETRRAQGERRGVSPATAKTGEPA